MPIDLAGARRNITSQYGEDGIIEAIFDTIGTRSKVAVEFGGADLEYLSNTYSLWTTRDWRVFLFEGDKAIYAKMLRQRASVANAKGIVVLINAFVTTRPGSRIVDLLADAGHRGEVDLMVIDIDGGDYHIVESLEPRCARALIVEMNATFPPEIDYVPQRFENSIGASARAITRAAAAKGYVLVACTKANCVYILQEYASLFEHAGDLDCLFDRSSLSYAFKTYAGGVFFSNASNPMGYSPFDKALQEVDRSRFFVPGNTVRFFAAALVLHLLKPLAVAVLHTIREPYSKNTLRGSWWERPLVAAYRKLRGTARTK